MRNIRVFKQCRYLRSKYQLVLTNGVKQRFNAYPVSRKKYPVPHLVIYRKCVYAIEPFNAILSPFYEAFQYDFSIRTGFKRKILFQFRTYLVSVIEFPVIYYDVISVFARIRHRLPAALNVNDSKTGVDECCLFGHDYPALIRTAAKYGALHIFVYLHIRPHILSKTYCPCYSAHITAPPLSGIRHAEFSRYIICRSNALCYKYYKNDNSAQKGKSVRCCQRRWFI